ncbi:MAG: hypothetical protein ACRDPD_30640, partial [Streptosporangiaceae bacterium]
PGTAPKPEFDPAARTLTERALAKADELGVTLRTVERMLRRYRDQGLWGLVDARHAKRARPTGNVDPRVVAAAAAVIDAQTRASTGTKSRAVRQIKRMVEDEHGPRRCRCRRTRRSTGSWTCCRRAGTRSARR